MSECMFDYEETVIDRPLRKWQAVSGMETVDQLRFTQKKYIDSIQPSIFN